MLCFNLISDANRQFSSQYSGELANHLPMDLVALERMGASEERLCNYRNHYVKRLEPRLDSLGLEISTKNWKDYLGQNKFHLDYQIYFERYLAKYGLKQTLQCHLPKLFRGVAGGAFHGLIRLGYAIDSENVEEVCEALAYWAVSFLDLGVGELSIGRKHPVEIFSELSAKFLDFRPEAPNIARRMEMIGQSKCFRSICAGLNSAETEYATLAPLVLALFDQTLDFTALHAVTATHAFRVVSEYCVASSDLFVGLAAAYVSIRAPKLHEIAPNQILIQWERLKHQAINSNDDHVPKIVYTCFEEYRVHGDPTYFAAASKYVEMFI